MQQNTQLRLVVLICVLVCIILPSVAQTESRAIAQAAHPRLFFSAGDIPSLQNLAVSTHQDIWQPILEYVNVLAISAPPAPPSINDVGPYASAGNQLIPLAFSCVITSDPDLCDAARTYLLNVIGWPTWDIGSERGRGCVQTRR